MTKTTQHSTHEHFIHGVRDLVVDAAIGHDENEQEIDGIITVEQAAKLRNTKLVYGVGNGSYRGVCHYSAWQNGVGTVDVVEIAATGEESWIQLAGTTIHELGHVLTGWGHGHDTEWKDSAKSLGFTIRPAAAGQVYSLAMIRPKLRHEIYRLAQYISDGSPAFMSAMIPLGFIGRPCSAGVGVKGGKSRGKGTGSRLRLWECECEKPVKVRVASDTFAAHCDECGASFHKVEKVAAADDAAA